MLVALKLLKHDISKALKNVEVLKDLSIKTYGLFKLFLDLEGICSTMCGLEDFERLPVHLL